MIYQIEISSVAEAEADQAFLWLSRNTSLAKARQWYAGLLTTIDSLAEMPKRCPLARENEQFTLEIRQLLYGKGRNAYQILFTILENQATPAVRILHIRHTAQKSLDGE